MSSQEEPELQLGFPSHRHMDDTEPQPALMHDASQYHEWDTTRNCDKHGSDNTISEVDSDRMYSSKAHKSALESQIDDTQFVSIEPDTQPMIDFDPSPRTREALESARSISTNIPPPMIDVPLLERANYPTPDIPGFRFATPPKPNCMKFSRSTGPTARRDQETAKFEGLATTKASKCVVDGVMPQASLPNRGGAPKPTQALEEKEIDSILPVTQNGVIHIPDQTGTHIRQTLSPNSQLSHSRTTQTLSANNTRSEEPLPRMRNVGKPPFEDTSVPPKTSVSTHLLDTPNNQNVADQSPFPQIQSGMQANLKMPPFVEDVLTSESRAQVTGVSMTTMPILLDTDACVDRSPGYQKLPKVRSSNANSPEPHPVIGSAGGYHLARSHEELNCIVQEIPEVILNEQGGDGNTTQPLVSDKDNLESQHQLRSLSINHKLRPRNRDDGTHTSKGGTTKLPPSRPQLAHQLQPQDINQNRSLHGIQDSRISKKYPSKIKNAHNMQSNEQVPNGISENITSADMLHMATVMATAEKEQREVTKARTQFQEAQIKQLSDEKTTLCDHIKCLEDENKVLFEKVMELQKRAKKYKDHINEVIKAQKELGATAKRLERKKFEFVKEAALEMDAELSKTKASLSEKSREVLREARQKLDNQEQLIALLNNKLESRVLEIQRERGLAESLQKQLEDREKQQQELMLMLTQYQQSTIMVLAGHEDIIKGILDAGADRGTSLDECLNLIKTIHESEPKSLPALNELTQLVVALSASVENRLQKAEDGGAKIREASIEVLTELKSHLKVQSDDHGAQRKLTISITELREENAVLKERIQNREAESKGFQNKVNDLEQELQKYRSQLSVAKDLRNALTDPREDPVLRVQLRDLQTSYSVLRDQSEASAKETERLRGNLHAQKESNLLVQQEIESLQAKLRESDTKISEFEAQKEAYVRQLGDESNKLRMQMERDVQARLAEDEAHHKGVVSGLRRQISETEARLVEIQNDLHDMDQTSIGKAAKSQELSDEQSTLSARIELNSTSLERVQEKLFEMEHHRDKVARELQISREQLIQCEKVAAEWRARAEDNYLLFTKHRKQINEEAKKSKDVAEVEVSKLKSQVMELNMKNEESKTLEGNIARYLRDAGLLKLETALGEWIMPVPSKPSPQGRTDLDPRPNSVICEFSSEIASPYRLRNEGTGSMIPDYDSPLLQKNLVFNLVSPRKNMIGDSSNEERIMQARSPEPDSTLCEQNCSFPATEAISRPHSRGSDHIVDSALQSDDRNKVTHDSQEGLIQELLENFTEPTWKVAQRRNSIAVLPQAREGKKTTTRTEVTEYSIRTSKTYEGTSIAQRDVKDTDPSGVRVTELKSAESDENSSQSSSLSDPLSDLDLTELLDDYTGIGHKPILPYLPKKVQSQTEASHLVPGPKSNTSRVRTTLSVEADQISEMKPPKSILKRAKSNIQNKDVLATTYPSRVPKNSHVSKVQGVQGGIAANKRLSRPTIGNRGLDGTSFNSPYNRIVSGTKSSEKTNNFQERSILSLAPETSIVEVSAVSSSPAIGQPQRNSRKRLLSRIGIDDHRPAKLQRLGK